MCSGDAMPDELPTTALRTSSRTRRRVSYALPSLRSKLRQVGGWADAVVSVQGTGACTGDAHACALALRQRSARALRRLQGDSFTFGDPSALPKTQIKKRVGARTKPRAKFAAPVAADAV